MLTALAEFIGETTQNTDDSRKRMLNSAYRRIANERLWWWLETSTTDTTTTALSYTLPTDFRAFRERNPVKIGSNWRILIHQADQQLWDGTSGVVTLPTVSDKRRAYLWGGKIYFVQDSMDADETITYYYYQTLEDSDLMDETSDTPLVPLDYREMIPLLAAGRYQKSQGGRESVEGNDYLELYDQYMTLMNNEQDNRRKLGILRRTLDPEEALIFRR